MSDTEEFDDFSHSKLTFPNQPLPHSCLLPDTSFVFDRDLTLISTQSATSYINFNDRHITSNISVASELINRCQAARQRIRDLKRTYHEFIFNNSIQKIEYAQSIFVSQAEWKIRRLILAIEALKLEQNNYPDAYGSLLRLEKIIKALKEEAGRNSNTTFPPDREHENPKILASMLSGRATWGAFKDTGRSVPKEDETISAFRASKTEDVNDSIYSINRDLDELLMQEQDKKYDLAIAANERELLRKLIVEINKYKSDIIDIFDEIETQSTIDGGLLNITDEANEMLFLFTNDFLNARYLVDSCANAILKIFNRKFSLGNESKDKLINYKFLLNQINIFLESVSSHNIARRFIIDVKSVINNDKWEELIRIGKATIFVDSDTIRRLNSIEYTVELDNIRCTNLRVFFAGDAFSDRDTFSITVNLPSKFTRTGIDTQFTQDVAPILIPLAPKYLGEHHDYKFHSSHIINAFPLSESDSNEDHRWHIQVSEKSMLGSSRSKIEKIFIDLEVVTTSDKKIRRPQGQPHV